eukprot:s290_g7.t2
MIPAQASCQRSRLSGRRKFSNNFHAPVEQILGHPAVVEHSPSSSTQQIRQSSAKVVEGPVLASVSQWCCFAFEPIATMVGLGSLPDIRETSLPAAVSQEEWEKSFKSSLKGKAPTVSFPDASACALPRYLASAASKEKAEEERQAVSKEAVKEKEG